MSRLSLAAGGLSLALCVGAAFPPVAIAEKRWDKNACEMFKKDRDAESCTYQAIQAFASLVNEPAQLIAEQAVKSCDWAWRGVYDQEGHLGVTFDQFLKTWADQMVIVVLESRLPKGSPRPNSDIQLEMIAIRSGKLAKDCTGKR
jgi:hypothetical protein